MLIALFFVVALLYASVGFGGGSSYNALLVLFGVDFRVVPLVALTCNVAVVSGNVLRYRRAGLLRVRDIMPAVMCSVPAAWLGGRLPIREEMFVVLLGCALLVAGAIMFVQASRRSIGLVSIERASINPVPRVWLAAFGAATGMLAGTVGIGGGIFFAPILYALRWGEEKQIAAACSLFILVNSVAGAIGQASRLSDLDALRLAVPYWPLVPAVWVGGWLGNAFGILRLSGLRVRQATAALMWVAAIRLLSHI